MQNKNIVYAKNALHVAVRNQIYIKYRQLKIILIPAALK
jgi:hypothetical protein